MSQEVIYVVVKNSYRVTGFVVLVIGIMFFLRDIDPNLNFIGNTSGWTIILVIIGAGLVGGGDIGLKASEPKKASMR